MLLLLLVEVGFAAAAVDAVVAVAVVVDAIVAVVAVVVVTVDAAVLDVFILHCRSCFYC